jgi:hypothetical protein
MAHESPWDQWMDRNEDISDEEFLEMKMRLGIEGWVRCSIPGYCPTSGRSVLLSEPKFLSAELLTDGDRIASNAITLRIGGS